MVGPFFAPASRGRPEDAKIVVAVEPEQGIIPATVSTICGVIRFALLRDGKMGRGWDEWSETTACMVWT